MNPGEATFPVVEGLDLPSRRRVLAQGATLATALLAAEAAPAQDNLAGRMDFTVVLTARRMRFNAAENRLTLGELSPSVRFFSDGPERIVGGMTTEAFAPFLREAIDDLRSSPPRADVSILENGTLHLVAVVLQQPVIERGSLHCTIRVTNGEMPATGEDVSMFIDMSGIKPVPISLANIARYDTLASLLASTVNLVVGELVNAEGWWYKVAPAYATNHHLTTAGGSKLIVLPDGHVYNFKAFGPMADGVADDFPKLMLAISAVSSPLGAGTGPAIYFPDACYFIGQTVELKKAVRLLGHGSGQSWDARAMLKFPPDTAGIVVNRHDTLGGNVGGASTGADCSIIEGLRITGSGGTDQSKPGIWLRARAIIRNCFISNFPGDGITIAADALAGGALRGNANNWHIHHTSANGNGRHGLYVQGGDTNAGLCLGCDFSYNGRWGIYENSFLGNTFVGIHVDSNGVPNAGFNGALSSTVAHRSVRYSANPEATSSQLAETEPGTSEAVWVRVGSPNGYSPEWQPGGTYFSGGGYWAAGLSQAGVFVGCYEESGSAGHCFGGRNLVLGGLLSESIAGGSVRAFDGDALTAASFSVPGAELGGNEPNGDILRWDEHYRLRRVGNDFRIDWANLDAGQIAYITGSETTLDFGTGLPQPCIMGFPTLGLGFGADARRQTYGVSEPSGGAHACGDVVWNAQPRPGASAGWICVQSGAPGIWKTFGTIAD